MRWATAYQGRHHKGITISLHALREEGDLYLLTVPPTSIKISIHALREEGDRERLAEVARQVISIHALREEGDSVVAV